MDIAEKQEEGIRGWCRPARTTAPAETIVQMQPVSGLLLGKCLFVDSSEEQAQVKCGSSIAEASVLLWCLSGKVLQEQFPGQTCGEASVPAHANARFLNSTKAKKTVLVRHFLAKSIGTCIKDT